MTPPLEKCIEIVAVESERGFDDYAVFWEYSTTIHIKIVLAYICVATMDAFRQSVEYIKCNYEFQKCLTRVFTKLHAWNTFASITFGVRK